MVYRHLITTKYVKMWKYWTTTRWTFNGGCPFYGGLVHCDTWTLSHKDICKSSHCGALPCGLSSWLHVGTAGRRSRRYTLPVSCIPFHVDYVESGTQMQQYSSNTYTVLTLCAYWGCLDTLHLWWMIGGIFQTGRVFSGDLLRVSLNEHGDHFF